jgi:hypothetical protein
LGRQNTAIQDLLRLNQAPAAAAAAASATTSATAVATTAAHASLLQPGRQTSEVLAPVAPTYWKDVVQQYRQRRVAARAGSTTGGTGPAPGVPGVANWIPIGPSVVRKGQAGGRPAISGRSSGVAIASGGSVVYICTADGGVWRSADGGKSWSSLMDNLDLQPTAAASTSLACGAVAIDPTNSNHVYVGTGEGDTNAIFSARLTSALPCYRGVGVLVSSDAGTTWVNEPEASGSPALAGAAFFSLAVDPANGNNVVGGTNLGLYHREASGGSYQWAMHRAGIYSSVVVARTGSTTTFFAANWGDQVYKSTDGVTWTAVGTGFPTGVSRIGLAVQHTNPNTLYAMVCDSGNALLGVYRLDNMTGAWHNITGAPSTVLGGQGTYDLAFTVDPNNADILYMGGQASGSGGAIYRGSVTGTAPNYSMTTTFIGNDVHADVHVLLNAPGDSNTLFACCDGGVFKTSNATGAATFTPCNTGLATVSSMFLAQHPTQPAVIFVGLQDNGTARYTGEECWSSVGEGDGGYCVVNWNNPFTVLHYQDGGVERATDGGQDWSSWTDVTPPVGWVIMDEPLVSTPYNPGSPADANTVAFGAGTELFISGDFGTTWTPAITVGGPIFAMIFASATRLFVGTTNGQVYRYDKSGSSWNATRLDNVAAGPLALTGLITDLEVDPADAAHNSVYLSFGGTGDWRHVWHFNGTSWQARSGPSSGAATSLLDVEHNALIVDPSHPATIFVGADIGIWKSTDGGSNWTVLDDGLPEAAVLDLAIHQPSRLMRAALHGRGVFQYKLDPPAPASIELYVRDTTLDLGLTPTVDGLPDPAVWPQAQVVHWESPDIKVDVPTPAGYQTPSKQIDFLQFVDVIVDGSQGTATNTAGTVVNRVYVEVHNRGITTESSLRVMLLLANASAGLPPLPAGYTAHVTAGTPITSSLWQTIGFQTITNLKTGFPQVAEFDLPASKLPPPSHLPGQSHYCLLAILHSSADPFTSTQTNTDALTIADRKVCQKNIHIVQFTGTPPPPSATPSAGITVDLMLNGVESATAANLELDLTGFPAQVNVSLPKQLALPAVLAGHTLDQTGLAAAVSSLRVSQMKTLTATAFEPTATTLATATAANIAEQPMLVFNGGAVSKQIAGLQLAANTSYPVSLVVQRPAGDQTGKSYRFRAITKDAKGNITGGSTYIVDFV